MNWKGHVSFGLVFFCILIYYLKINIFSLNFLSLLTATLIFSLLPDIDHSRSHISHIFVVFSLLLGAFGIYEYYFNHYNFGLLKTGTAVALLLYHNKVAINSPFHRQFPHTFTFGIMSSSILVYYTELLTGFVGLSSFIIHLMADGHVIDALRKDKEFWRKLLTFKW